MFSLPTKATVRPLYSSRPFTSLERISKSDFAAYTGNDHPRELPMGKLSLVNMAVYDDEFHYKMTGPTAHYEWAALRPPNGGDVFLPDPSSPSSTLYTVSMWHQLQCLNHIRTVFVHGDTVANNTDTSHCFHYLRQSFLCGADITLEAGGASMVNPHGGTVAPEANATHTCRDWTQVYKWTVDQQKKWTTEMVELQRNSTKGTILEMLID